MGSHGSMHAIMENSGDPLRRAIQAAQQSFVNDLFRADLDPWQVDIVMAAISRYLLRIMLRLY